MKIDAYRLTPDTDATKSTDGPRKVTDRTTTAPDDRARTPGSDKVEVSADAKLLAAALKSTQDVQPVRTDVVEAMKRKLAAGEIGTDAGRLADRMMDDLLAR